MRNSITIDSKNDTNITQWVKRLTEEHLIHAESVISKQLLLKMYHLDTPRHAGNLSFTPIEIRLIPIIETNETINLTPHKEGYY